MQNGVGHGAAKVFVWEIGQTDNFLQLVGGGSPTSWPPKRQKCPEMNAHKAKTQGNEGPKRQSKEMKARKAKLQGNEGPTRPKCKEMKAYKAKIQGNEGLQSQKE